MRRVTIVLIAATAALLLAACGGSGEEASPTPGTATSLTPSASYTATPRPQVASPARCQPSREPAASYNVQITAKWKGKDRIVIEGSADLPGPGSVNYFVCQDGQVSASLLWARQPTFEDGKIRAESQVVDSSAGPVFDPNAQFNVVLSILGEPIQVPYFTVSIPVEGQPD